MHHSAWEFKMELTANLNVINLDALAEDAIIIANTDKGRLILSKAQLFARLGNRRKPKAVATGSRATRIKSDK